MDSPDLPESARDPVGEILNRDDIEGIQEAPEQEEMSKQQTESNRMSDVHPQSLESPREVAEALDAPIESEPEAEESEAEEDIPLLFVDVNLGPENYKRIVLYEGDDPETVAADFAQANDLDESMREKLTDLLKKQISSVLVKIEEGDGEGDEEEMD